MITHVPRVSVIIPFRDAEDWLPATLASLAEQRDLTYELVAVDDGSRDQSTEVLQRCWAQLGRPAPMRLLRVEGDAGVSAARNCGWRLAAAPLVAFLDADDLCLGQRLALQARCLESDPSLGQVLCGWRRMQGLPLRGGAAPAAEVEVRPWLEGAGFDTESAFRHKAVLPSAWMLRRSALELVGGFDPSLRHAEDVDLLLRLAIQGVRGAWVEEVLCGYRVHGGGASSRLRSQTQGLLWVMGKALQRLHPGHPLLRRREEMLLGTRSWLAWKAWSEGEEELALGLWRSAWGGSPLGPAGTWLHLAQAMESGSRREGHPFAFADLLEDPGWQRLECHVVGLLRQRDRQPFPTPDTAVPEEPGAGYRRGWGLLAHGYHQAGLVLWRDLLALELQNLERSGETSPWIPGALLEAWQGEQDSEAEVVMEARRRGLAWCSALLAWDGAAEGRDRLMDDLVSLLTAWARLCWGQHGDSALVRLEKAFALRPDPSLLRAVARLYESHGTSGAIALNRLAERLEAFPPSPPWDPPEEVQALASLPEPLAVGGRCRGPSCQACGRDTLGAWERRSLTPDCDFWIPPYTDPLQGSASAAALEVLPEGRAWIRPPLESPWFSTTAVAVVDREGIPREVLCRRYPQAWPACPENPVFAIDPEPSTPPLELAGTVLAVVDLSAEIHYHWLLEHLPRLGQALESLPPEERARLRVWHNGGTDSMRAEVLTSLLGLQACQLIDARHHPHIRAERLLVPPFSGRFGWPPASAQDWLRKALVPEKADASRVASRRLWLARGRNGSTRRPVWGEASLLQRLDELGISLEPVELASLKLVDQAHLISEAEWVVAAHGGALAGLVFASPGARVLELHQPRYAPPYFHAIVQHCGLHYARCRQPDVSPHLYQELVYEGALVEPIRIDPLRSSEALKALIAAA
jgi:GT2 family glycosyltransferase